jgi:hypothetical protein
MKIYPVPEEFLTDTLDNFGRTSTIDGSLCGEASDGNTLRFASHEESYMTGGFS